MFESLYDCNIIGFDTETGTRFTATDTDLIEFSQKLPEEYKITDYSDTYDAYAAVIKTAAYVSKHCSSEFRKEGDLTMLQKHIKEYALKCIHPADKLHDYDLISKVTYPRYACIVGVDFSNIKDFTKAEDIFYSDHKENFVLKDHSIDFINLIIKKIRAGQNFAIITFNMEYDFNCLMCNIPPTYLQKNNIVDERLPTKIHADKTITWKDADKNNKGCCKWVDSMLLSEKGMSIKKYGEIASELYKKDYHKTEDYDYSNIIYSAKDLEPTKAELKYCYRDVQLALWGLSYLLRQHVETLNKCDLLAKPSDLPITCSHLYDMVNVINTLNINMDYNKSKRKKFFSSYKKRTAKDNELHYNPPDIDMYHYLKKGFGGGKITFNPLFLEKKLQGGNGYSLDLCSAYPFQLVNMYPDMQELFIMTSDYFVKNLPKIERVAVEINKGNFVNTIPVFKYGYTARIIINNIRLKRDMQLPLLGINDGALKGDNIIMIRNRIIAADSAEITVTHIDLITILAAYDYSSIQFLSGYVYKLKQMNTNLRRKFITAAQFKSGLKKFVKMDYKNFPYKLFNEFVGKELLTGKESEAELADILADAYQNSKVLFNGIYGKSCQSLIHNKKYIDEEGNISITEDKYKPRQGTCYTTGRFIATYTRLHLCIAYFIALRNISEKDLILYAHTDSIKLYLYGRNHLDKIYRILHIFNEGINTEYESFVHIGKKSNNEKKTKEILKAYDILKNNGIGYLEDEVKNRFCKAVVCGNMRILTEDENGNCHITFSGVNVPYVLSGGKQNYKPAKLKDYMRKEGIFNLYDQYFNSGKKYTMYESCKTALDYKHYNMVLNPELGHICQTIKEMPIEINGDPESLKRDQENIKIWRMIKNAN